MAELPFHLKTLEPLKGALDILRFFGVIDSPTADADSIKDALGLSDRAMPKAIRRLVTKQYIVMEGDMVYRLTEKGHQAVEELNEYDGATGTGLELPDDFDLAAFGEEEVAEPLAAADLPFDLPPEIAEPAAPEPEPEPEPETEPEAPQAQEISRRMIVAVPQVLVANQPANLIVGFHDAPADAQMPGAAQLVVNVSVVNGQPETPEPALFSLTNENTQQAVQITPGQFKEIRVKLEASQMGATGGISEVGGMYVDVPVAAEGGSNELIAFGADVKITV